MMFTSGTVTLNLTPYNKGKETQVTTTIDFGGRAETLSLVVGTSFNQKNFKHACYVALNAWDLEGAATDSDDFWLVEAA